MPNSLDLTFCCLLCVKGKLQYKAMVKQGSCAFMNVSDVLEVAETNGNSFRNCLTAILSLLLFWYNYFLYVVVWLMSVTFVQLSVTHEVITCHCYL
jgi:hypothetical protein